jgi:hypothetical protein
VGFCEALSRMSKAVPALSAGAALPNETL